MKIIRAGFGNRNEAFIEKNFSDKVNIIYSNENNKGKTLTSINVENVWVIEQKFCDTDNREEEASYYALVEFKKGAGYRVIFMSVNGKQVFP